MRSSWTLPLLSLASFAFAQDCPAGYGRSIQWGPCGGTDATLSCSTMDVPLDYTDQSGKLTLPLLRINATSEPASGTIFYNPGGPGASAIYYLALGGKQLQTMVGPSWNIITFDPRGVNLNTPYNCTGGSSQGSPDNFTAGLAGFDDVAAFYNGDAATCALPPYDVSGQYVGTAADATDIIAVYNALARNAGENGKVYYWGFSYGTLLGATLSQMFPGKMERVVLDGNINPTDYYDGVGYETLADFDNEVRRFFQQCVEATTSCALYKGPGTTQQTLTNQLDTFLAQTGNRNLTELYQFEGYLFNAMYGVTTWRQLATYLDGLFNNGTLVGSGPANLRRRDAAFQFNPKATPLYQPEILNAITCGDARKRFGNTGADFQTYYNQFKQVSLYGTDSYIGLPYSCQAWKVNAKSKPVGLFAGITPSANILFLNGRYDPVTPLISANASSAGFANSGVVISDGAGHCTGAQPSTELQLATAQYFIDGQIPVKRSGYTLNQPNPFITTVVPSPGGANNTVTQRDLSILGVGEAELLAAMEFIRDLHGESPLVQVELPALQKRSQSAVYPELYRRQAPGIPAGCQPLNGTIVSTTSSTAAATTASTLSSSASVSTSSTTGGDVGPTLISTASTSTASGASQSSTGSSTASASGILTSTSSSTLSTITSSASYTTSSSYTSTGGITKTITITNCETVTKCAPGVAHCPPHTITHTTTTRTVLPTVTSWWADLVDVCPTGLTTHHVPITHHCPTGCDARPTGVPDGYSTTKAWCEACKPSAKWVDATVPVNGWPAVESEAAVAAGTNGKPKPNAGNGANNAGGDDAAVAGAHGGKPSGGNGGSGSGSGSDNNVADAHGTKPNGGNSGTGSGSGSGNGNGGDSGSKPSSSSPSSATGWDKPAEPAAETGKIVAPYKGAASSIGGSAVLVSVTAVVVAAVLGAAV